MEVVLCHRADDESAPVSETGVPSAGSVGLRSEDSVLAAGFCGCCAGCSRFMPKRLLPSEDDLSPVTVLLSWAEMPAIMSSTMASAVDCANVAIVEFAASAACGEVNSRGISQTG